MTSEFPGWITAQEAVKRYPISYQSLRRMVHDGTFTKGNFSPAKERPPIYVRIDELEAFKLGGVDAVRRVQGGAKPGEKPFANILGPDLGGEGG